MYFESLSHEYKFSYENASIKRLIMTLFLVFDILIHYKYCKFAVMAASASRPCLKPLSLTLCSFHIFSSPYPLAATLFQHDSGMRMLRRKHDAWGCKLHIPFGLDALHFKRVRTPRFTASHSPQCQSSALFLDFFNFRNISRHL